MEKIKYTERRKHKRYETRNQAIAMVKSQPGQLDSISEMSKGEVGMAVYKSKPHKLGQIVNVGRGGLSFSYISKEYQGDKVDEIDILLADDDFYLKNIQFKTIIDAPLEDENNLSPLEMKTQSIKFINMTTRQSLKLEYFLKYHTKTKNNKYEMMFD